MLRDASPRNTPPGDPSGGVVYCTYRSILGGNLNIQDAFPRYHQHMLQYSECAGISSEQVCAKCTISELTTTLPYSVSYFYCNLLTLLMNQILLNVLDCNRLYEDLLLLLIQLFPRHFLCVCKYLRNKPSIFKTFVCFDLA